MTAHFMKFYSYGTSVIFAFRRNLFIKFAISEKYIIIYNIGYYKVAKLYQQVLHGQVPLASLTGNLALLLLDGWLLVQKKFLFRDIEPPLQSYYCIWLIGNTEVSYQGNSLWPSSKAVWWCLDPWPLPEPGLSGDNIMAKTLKVKTGVYMTLRQTMICVLHSRVDET